MLKKIIAILAIGIILSGNTTVYAATAYADFQYVTVYGINYKYRSHVTADSGSVHASTHVSNTVTANVPIGYFGISSRLYNSSGSLITSTEWFYNPMEVVAGTDSTSSVKDKGAYYSKGMVKFYNGNGYTTYTCNQSPNVQLASVYLPSKNDNGEIYGSEYFLNLVGIEPDLIQAEGTNGILGYVRADELSGKNEPSSPEEAILFNESSQYEISLYSSDGITVIGTFLIKSSASIYEECVD